VGSNLTKAELTSANLDDANLAGTDMEDAKFTADSIREAYKK
jgi:uncharacterized protein YjbI with pentapeptide repeats